MASTEPCVHGNTPGNCADCNLMGYAGMAGAALAARVRDLERENEAIRRRLDALESRGLNALGSSTGMFGFGG